MDKHEKLYKIYQKYEKIDNWYTAIGLQKVDNLEPSSYLLELISLFEDDQITEKELEDQLYKYYELQRLNNKQIIKTYECDIVSSRMAKLLNNYKKFYLSEEYLKLLHYNLFKDIYVFAGTYRKTNLFKKEKILDGKTVSYSNYQDIESYLEYDFNEFKNKNFTIENLAKFISNIWQVHPFNEGNTRTVILFTLHYLQKQGLDVDYHFFKNDSKAFRNSLVISNYENLREKIYPDISLLENYLKRLTDKKSKEKILVKKV